MLDLDEVSGKRVVATRLMGNVVVSEAHAAAALEVMSRFAVNPRWLIYLPPTMSPCETSSATGVLEHPVEAFSYYRTQGAAQVVCQEKHMGSRAVAIVCRDDAAARRAFGVAGEGAGIVYTRTGRRFFDKPALETEMIARVQAALTKAGVWERLRNRLGVPGRRAAAVVGQGAGVAALAVRRRGRGGGRESGTGASGAGPAGPAQRGGRGPGGAQRRASGCERPLYRSRIGNIAGRCKRSAT